MSRHIPAAVISLALSTLALAQSPAGRITDVPGIRIGHHTLTERPTGCTVILAPPNTVGAVDQRGGAPGTRETNLLSPENSVSVVHAIVLSGGSAFGLSTADGVMKYLAEHKIGYPVSGTVVPIVPAAILLDLAVGGRPDIRPGPDCGYQAAATASEGAVAEGSVGAGAGATVGKFMNNRPMKGGIGTASLRGPNGLIVGAIVAVNASGSVIDRRTGLPVAGVRAADGFTLEDPFALIRGAGSVVGREMENTTIGVVATNARLTKAQALRVSMMAQDGLARAIFPAHTPGDGDTLFVLATGGLAEEPNVSRIGSLAAEAVSDAILRAVREATGLPGYPSVKDIKR
ncbi:MAG TPA: P1 family peptidase [Vicinamibacterales bacterium]|nr:P1 family peptidase [Vicinamibacterales bacterium]